MDTAQSINSLVANNSHLDARDISFHYHTSIYLLKDAIFNIAASGSPMCRITIIVLVMIIFVIFMIYLTVKTQRKDRKASIGPLYQGTPWPVPFLSFAPFI